MSIKVTETKIIDVVDSNGNVLKAGNPIMIRIKGQDIVCRYYGIANGYFVTQTLDGEIFNKYRMGSIESCKLIFEVELYDDHERVADTEMELK